jgi:hypothetical protein
MEPSTIYYCAQGVASIAKVAINYKKAMDVNESVGLKLDKLQFTNKSIKDFLDLIRNDIQSMMHMHFRSAYENLNYALHANANNKKEYLVQARNRFIDASTIERNDNLILTYLGLAFCQELLDDLANSNITLNKIRGVYWEDIYSDDILLKNFWDSGWREFFNNIIFRIMSSTLSNMLISNSFGSLNLCDLHTEIDSWFSRMQYSSHDEYLKEIYHIRLKTLVRCGWNPNNIYDFKKTEYYALKAEKSILQENFSSLKQDVISSFQLAD